jgi:PTS system nitrogen regulatory IIA component
MELTVHDVSKLLNISERTIYRWIRQEAIPAYKIMDQYRFNRAELLQWAASRRIGVSAEMYKEADGADKPLPTLSEALRVGGIHYRVGGVSSGTVLRAVIDLLRLPAEVDREFLLSVLLAREELASTGIGDGIAIPHVRNPVAVNVPYSMVALCFLEHAVDFHAIDGKPVYCLLPVVSPNVRTHLHLLSRIALVLRDEEMRACLARQETRERLMQTVEQIESGVHGNKANGSA